LVGNPNVGKSALFNRLTGAYAAVSNYPGTTVAIDEGRCKLNGREFAVIDSPGMYSLLPITEEERVAKRLLLEERPALVLHVVDAKNLERMLPLTLQLIEADLPVMLILNMMDEAEKIGIKINREELETVLGIPVIPVVATAGSGFEELMARINEYAGRQQDSSGL
jgi:ferrous iron transport protein B